MNITQLQERLRLELLRRIQRGSLSLSLLSRQTGLGVSHISNFLHNKRGLSLESMDRILAAQGMALADLLPASRPFGDGEPAGGIPLVSHETAMHEPVVRHSAVRRILHLPHEMLRDVRAHCPPGRKAWMRFVAIRVGAADAAAMSPIILPDALVVVDRHYNSLVQYHPDRPNLYAVRSDAHLVIRYADFQASRLVLRPHNRGAPIQLLEMDGDKTPGDLIAGRVIVVINCP
jgi:transcriptional regulator with XRE-family HTH domain